MLPEFDARMITFWAESPIRGLVKVGLLSMESLANALVGSLASPEAAPYLFMKFVAERAQDPGVLIESLIRSVSVGMKDMTPEVPQP
jgi:hypothetical protein